MSAQSATWNWKCRKSSTKVDNRIIPAREEVTNHPLQRFINKNRINAPEKPMLLNQVTKKDGIFPFIASDPMDNMLEGNDPLSMFQKQERLNTESDDWESSDSQEKDQFKGLEPWSSKKELVLVAFNSNEILPMTSCFSLQDKGTSSLKGRPNRPDDYEDGIIFEINDIYPQDYCRRINVFHKEVTKAWNEDQRVRALKIAIQCSKLLSDSYAYSFYPVKYVHITDILDTFGELVYKRLREKCQQTGKPELFGKNLRKFPEKFTLDMVPELAKETCHNWFYKIASIRELIPRLYVELALLRSYSFITSGKNGEILKRISDMINGVGDPLVAMYLRCYLCRVAVKFGADDYNFFNLNFDAIVNNMSRLFANCKSLRLTMELSKYIEACMPPLQWIVQGLISMVSPIEVQKVYEYLMSSFEKTKNNTVLVYLMLTAAQPSYIVTHGHSFLKWIEDADYLEVPLHKLLLNLGRKYEEFMKEHSCQVEPKLAHDIWTLICKVQNKDHFMTLVDQWMPFIVPHLAAKKVNEVLGDIHDHMFKEVFSERIYAQMESIVRNLTDGIEDFMSLLIVENFSPFLNLFRSENVKVTICKITMEAFVKRGHETFINDSVILNNLMHIARILHDSINALTVEDEKRQISVLISNFVRRMDFGRDFEPQLDFYVEARGAFYNLDMVHATLVQCVNKIAFETLKLVRGRHTKRTSAFVRACAAYSFITIPSIASPLCRLQLYIISSQTTLANQCLGQADAYFKAILDTIADIPKIIEEKGEEKRSQNILISYIKEFMSILLVAPDNTCDEGSLYLVRTLTNVIQQYAWEEPNSAKVYLFTNVLHLLSVSYQDYYPYNFFNVDSNDILYASDMTFREDIESIGTVVLEQILRYLHVLGMSGQDRKQAELAFELFYCVLLRADIVNLEMAKLAVNLWNLANKNNSIDKAPALGMIEYCMNSSEPGSKYADIFSKLLAKFESS